MKDKVIHRNCQGRNPMPHKTMEFELTEEQIRKVCLDNRLNLVPIEIIARNVSYEAQRELWKHLWEKYPHHWEGSSIVFQIPEAEVKALLKHFEVENVE